MKWTVRIDYKEGESPRDRMVRISRIVQTEKRNKGASQVSMSRTVNELSNALRDTQKDQFVSLSDDTRGSIARRSPTVNLATNTGVKELDTYITKTLPDMSMLETYQSPRQKALSLALPSAVGVPSNLRVPNLESNERLMAANILGSLPSAGMTLEESARNKLAATVKQALGDLGVSPSEVRSMLRERLASRPFFNDPELIAQFSAMIKSYHDVRDNNLHYAQALVPGLKGLKSPERLTEAILPTPESILNGTTAHLIFQYGEKTTISEFKGWVRERIMQILNIQPEGRGIRATDKQLQVGSLLAEFDFNRKKAAKAMQKAVDDAISVGADFATAYSEIAYSATDSQVDKDTALSTLTTAFDSALDKYKDSSLLTSDASILEYQSQLGGGPNTDNDREFFDFLVKEGIIFPVLSSPSKKPKFYIVPVVLPSFTSNPIGWDRRWMIATMKIIDEYWDMIYNPNRKILIQDLLFLIATKTKELFNYDIDVVQMTILTLLLTPGRNARRRARSIMPRNASGEVPLRSLTQLLKDSARDQPAPGEAENLQRKLKKVEEQIAFAAAAAGEKKDDLKFIQETTNDVLEDLDDFLDGIVRAYTASQGVLVGEFANAIKPIIESLENAIDDEAKVETIIGPAINDLQDLKDDFADGEKYEAFKGQQRQFNEVIRNLIKTVLHSETYLKTVAITEFQNLNNGFKLGIEEEKEDPSDATKKIPRDIAELQADLYQEREKAKRRAARRGRRSSTMKEVGFVTAEVVIGTNVIRDIGMGIRDFVGGRSNRMEAVIDQSMQTLVKELRDRAAAIGGDHVAEIAIQPIVYGGAGMLTLIAHGVAYDTGGKGARRKAKKSASKGSCPTATQSLEVNTTNRNAARDADWIQYGPLNLEDDTYWLRYADKWNTSPGVAKKSNCSNCVAFDISPRMLDCLPGPTSEPIEDDEGHLGYCWMHHFKCHSARTCYTWAAGGPITKDKVSFQWASKAKANPAETGRTDSYDSYMLAKQAAQAQAFKSGETVYLWREGGKVKVSLFFPGKVPADEVTAIHPNPPKKEERKYKGMIISKVDGGWEVDAYGKVFNTLKDAREFISKKVKGTATPNQQCVRIIAGTRCTGTIVKMNKGGQYQCKKCKAKYKAV